MSERIDVNHAFDPEARQAQAELDAYMDTRPFTDNKGNIHSPDSHKKFMSQAQVDELHDTKRHNHYDESLAEGDYSGESLEQLAQRVAQARAEGDKTRANDAEEAFFNKFAEYSDKYGWEDEDGSADGPHVDKNAKLGRSTIDDRLDRYSKIMYGEDTVVNEEAPVGSGEVIPAVQATPASESENDSIAPKNRATTAEEDLSSESKPTGMDVDAEVEAAKAMLAEEAARKEAEALAEINGTDQAKADRELLEDSNRESASSKLRVLDEKPAVKASELKVLDEGEGVAEAPRSTAKRIRDALTPSGAAAEISAYAATREKGSRRNRLVAVLGGGALAAGLGWLMMRGHDVSAAKDIINPDAGSTDPGFTGVGPHGAPSANSGGGRDLVETVRVRPGDGEIKVTQALLDSNGVHVNVTEAQRIGEHARVNDILKGDSSYAHSGSSLDRIGKTGEFEARKGVVSKLLKAARQLGHK